MCETILAADEANNRLTGLFVSAFCFETALPSPRSSTMKANSCVFPPKRMRTGPPRSTRVCIRFKNGGCRCVELRPTKGESVPVFLFYLVRTSFKGDVAVLKETPRY